MRQCCKNAIHYFVHDSQCKHMLDFHLHIFRMPFQVKRCSTFVKRVSRLCIFAGCVSWVMKEQTRSLHCSPYFWQRTSGCVLKTEKPHSVSPTSLGFLQLNSDGRYSTCWGIERIEPLPNSHPLISEPERDKPYLAWRSSIVKASEELSRIHSGPVGRPGNSRIVFNTQNLQMYLGLCCTNPGVRQIHVLW